MNKTFRDLIFQTRVELISTIRSRQALFFAFGMPVMFLLIFGTLNSDAKIKSLGNLSFINFYVPGIIAYGILLSGMNNLAMTIAQLNVSGVFKRIRTTPLSWFSYTGGVVLASLLLTIITSLVLLLVGTLAYGASVPGQVLPAILFFLLGIVCFALLGIAAAALVPRPERGAGVLVLLTLPMLFISDVFYPLQGAPEWLTTLAKILPLEPLVKGMSVPFRNDLAVPWSGLLVLIVWSLIGAYFTRRYFQRVSTVK